MTPLRLVLATSNPDKAREIVEMLGGSGLAVELVPRPAGVPDVDEVGETLEDNARIKAQTLVDATGLPALADDTGLEVVALDGAPGVRSARFAGEHADAVDNTQKLLTLLDGVADDRRTARFATVALVRWPDGREVAALGTVEGTIVREPRGTSGFGYDPVFQPAGGGGRTFAEMTAAEKHAISHRGRALRTLAAGLQAVEGAGA